MLRSTPMFNPVSAAWNTVARFDEYQAAQRAVDRLSDDGFPFDKLAVFAFAAHSATRGERDFSSVRGLAATRYDLIAREGTVEQARTMLRHAGLLPDPAELTPRQAL
jgi:hypothetical protein